MKIFILAILIASSTAQAKPPDMNLEKIDLEKIDIEGTMQSPEKHESDRRKDGSPRISIGDAGVEGSEKNKSIQIKAEDAYTKARREEMEALKRTLMAMDDFNLDLATKELGGPKGRIVWYFIEVAKRMAVDGGLAPAHPMEDPKTFERDPYMLERVVQLRNELAAESDAAWKARPPKQMDEAATRAFSVMESNLIKAATMVSPEAGAATVFLLRLGRISSPMLATPSPAVEKFLKDHPVPSANACWSAESKVYRRIPLTVPLQSCPSFFSNGQATRYPGVTMYRPLGNRCSTGAMKSCVLSVADVSGADCFCVGPGGVDYGKVFAQKPVGFLP